MSEVGAAPHPAELHASTFSPQAGEGMIGASAQILRQPFPRANRAVSIVCGAIRFRLGARRLESERAGEGGARRGGLVDESKTVMAVEFAHDRHDAV